MGERGTDSEERVLSVVVPTYCEADNLPHLLERLGGVLDGLPYRSEILIVDDDSGDGTAECLASLGDSRVSLVVREGVRGLSGAVLEGLRRAQGDVLLVMDADLSHPPERIPEMVEAVEEGYDFVVGSRHVKGATTDENWGMFRWVNSFVATMMARPFTSVRDPMSGFFALPRRTFKRSDYLNPIGYKIGLELIVKCRCQYVKEVPIHFSDREHGESKLSLGEQLRYIQHIRRLFIYKFGGWADFAQFLVVGFSGVFVNLAVLTVLLWMSVSMSGAMGVAIVLSMLTNFLLNRRYSFSYARKGPFFRQLFQFCLACSLGGVLNYVTAMGVWAYGVSFVTPQLASLCGIAVGTLFNFLASRYLVFRQDSL
jgi:dolichol-phosphate mannosyltransferase